MIFFNFSQFFANQGPNAFYEEFLKTEGLTLEQILDHEDTVTEAKKSNSGLMALLQPQTARLIDYISKEPSPDAGEKEGHRYPFIANEILCSEAFLAELGKNPEMLPLVFQYLQSETPLNLTIAGYCAGLSQRLLERQGFKVLELLFNSDTDYSTLLLRHIDNRSVAELVVSILMVNAQFTAREKLLHGVILAYQPDIPRERVVSISYILLEVIRRSADVGEWKGLVATFLFKEVLQKYAQAVTWNGVGDQVATVLTAFISHSAFEDVTTFFAEVCESGFKVSTAFSPIVQSALTVLSTQTFLPEQDTTYASTVKQLGLHRLSLIQLVNTCMRAVGQEFDSLLVDWGYVNMCTQLFLEFPWHSGLHLAYETLTRTIIEEGSQMLKADLLEQVGLISILAETAKQTSPEEKYRKGYFGFITRIANNLLSASTSSPYFRQLLESETWINFAVSYLIPQNRLETSKYLENARKESDISSGEVQPILDDAMLEKEEAENDEGFEFKVSQNCLTPEELDARNLFTFGNEEVSSDPEVETAMGSDVYNSVSYWKLPISDQELEELE